MNFLHMHSSWHDPNVHRPPRQSSADVSARSLYRCEEFGEPSRRSVTCSILTFGRSPGKLIREPVRSASVNWKKAMIVQEFTFLPPMYSCARLGRLQLRAWKGSR